MKVVVAVMMRAAMVMMMVRRGEDGQERSGRIDRVGDAVAVTTKVGEGGGKEYKDRGSRSYDDGGPLKTRC